MDSASAEANLGPNEQTTRLENAGQGGAGPSDPRLNFLSEEFDATEVLRCSPSKVHLPHPSILPCDNLQAYLSVVQGVSRNPYFLPDAPKVARDLQEPDDVGNGVVDAEHVGLAGAGMPPSDSRPNKRHIKTVIDFMEDRSQTGPFSVLHQSWAEGRRVKVLTRHCAGVRGVCIGHVIAFDHHMNLVLGDVEEWWAPFKTVQNGGITLSKSQRRRRSKLKAAQHKEASSEEGCGEGCKWERYQVVKQLFLRGDNIILISTVTS